MAKYDDTEWFRSSRWDSTIEAQFEAKLRRARVWSRAQYIRIQATHLGYQDDPVLRSVGRELLRRVMIEYGDSDRIQALTASEQLADSFAADGQIDEALTGYRDTLDRIATLPTGRSGTSGVTELALAELHLTRGTPDDLDEATRLLNSIESEVQEQSFLRNVVLRYLTAQARLAHQLGTPTANTYAQLALAVADETEPALPRHPDVGRPEADASLRAELSMIANTPIQHDDLDSRTAPEEQRPTQ